MGGWFMKKKGLYLLAGILVITAAIFALSRNTQTGAQAPEEFQTVSAETRVVGSSLMASGTVKPALGAMTQLTAPGSGVVKEVLVEQGTVAKAGETLAVVVIDGAEQRIEKALLVLRLTELQLEQIKSGPREEEVARARISLEQAEKKLVDAKTSLAILEADEEIPEQQLDSARREVDNADAQYQLAQQQLSLTANKYTKNDIAQAEAKVQQAANDLSEARALAEQGTIKAPIDGVVVTLNIYPGAVVGGNSILMTIIDLNRLVVEAIVDETDIVSVQKGQQASITLDAPNNEKVDGTVVYVLPVAKNESGIINYPVIISLEHIPHGFYPDMTAVITIYLEEPEETLTVPAQAVRQSDGKQSVFVLEGNEIYETDVVTGRRSDGYVEIVSGLSAGEKVIIGAVPDKK
jgi:RND family efflux transporter MFP subunit